MATRTLGVSCDPNPDVAGLGVIISFVAAAILTLTLSAVCAFLRASAMVTAANSSPTFRPTPKLSPFSKLNPLLTEQPAFWSSEKPPKLMGVWHKVAEKVLLSLSFNQLVSGFALYGSKIGTYGASSRDPHAELAVLLSGIPIFSQLSVPFVVQRPIKRVAQVRVIAPLLYVAAVVLVENVIGRNMGLFSIIWPIMGFDAAAMMLYLLLAQSTSDNGLKKSITAVLARPLRKPWFQLSCGLLMPAGITISSIMWALDVKFDRWTLDADCDLNIPEENKWTLGQMLSVAMLLGLVLPALEVYWEEEEALQYEQTAHDNELESLMRTEGDDRQGFIPDAISGTQPVLAFPTPPEGVKVIRQVHARSTALRKAEDDASGQPSLRANTSQP